MAPGARAGSLRGGALSPARSAAGRDPPRAVGGRPRRAGCRLQPGGWEFSGVGSRVLPRVGPGTGLS